VGKQVGPSKKRKTRVDGHNKRIRPAMVKDQNKPETLIQKYLKECSRMLRARKC
jgi:hypothetical protein